MQKREERNSLNLVLDMNRTLCKYQLRVGERQGKASEVP